MRKIVNCLLIVSLLLILLSGCSTQEETKTRSKYTISGIPQIMGELPKLNFELASNIPDFPDKQQVYKMVKPDVTVEYVKALGAKFDLTGEMSEGTENFLLSDNKNKTYLEVYKATGTFRYFKQSYFEIPSASLIQKPPILPSDVEALKIATDYLVERDLLPRGDVAYKVDVGDSFGEIPTTLLVSFKHSIEIIGSKHGVRIGDGGEVVDVFINPTNPLELPLQEMVEVKSVQQAYEEVKFGNNYSAPSKARNVKIDNITIAYWLEAPSKEQDYVIPVYVFKGTCSDSDGKQLKDPFVAVVEAVK
jgi:hypothetical protein